MNSGEHRLETKCDNHVIPHRSARVQSEVANVELTTPSDVARVLNGEQHTLPLFLMMSRRESRVSINVRQNDALNEFENCSCVLLYLLQRS